MTKEKEKPQDQAPLTEWQKRNIEFLKKKQAEEVEREDSRKNEMVERRRQVLGQSPDEEEDDSSTVAEASSSSMDRRQQRAEKRRQKRQEKLRKKEQRNLKLGVPILQRYAANSVLVVSGLAILFSLFLLSPWSKNKVLTVSGTDHALSSDIITASGIKDSDYLTSIIFDHSKIEAAIKLSNVWVNQANVTYQFPNQLKIAIKEYPIVAYRQTQNGYTSILENGAIGGTVSSSNLPERFVTVNLDKTKDIKAFIQQFEKLPKSIADEIRIVTLAPTSATSDLLSIEMQDGNIVRVPLSQLDQKMPYYNKVKGSLSEPGIVDMEVGLYTTTKELEESASNTESSNAESTDTSTASDNADTTTSDNAETQSQTETSNGTDTQNSLDAQAQSDQ